MTPWEMLAVVAAGVGAGAANAVVGNGTLITFPVLLTLGIPPITATVSNALGLIPGSVSAAVGYRAALAGQRRRVLRFCAAAIPGGLAGATLLLVLPAEAFERIVPVLVGLALVLVACQPLISRAMQRRRPEAAAGRRGDGPPLIAGLALTSVYGGYFAASQGTLYLALMSAFLGEPLHRLNAIKNVLVGVVNMAAALVFLFVARYDWTVVLLIAAGSALGGQIGARLGGLLRPAALRTLIVAVGVLGLFELLRH
ncbi:sulfite exporter TauE/SafE family protein [Micromonospora sp. NPDC050397]|uniref:sulfite exporter TauE/SafE family protein n=1 Tax=Micromonospora sp. NPDC050397 TaxID=3364279 RepID=UPI00384A9049